MWLVTKHSSFKVVFSDVWTKPHIKTLLFCKIDIKYLLWILTYCEFCFYFFFHSIFINKKKIRSKRKLEQYGFTSNTWWSWYRNWKADQAKLSRLEAKWKSNPDIFLSVLCSLWQEFLLTWFSRVWKTGVMWQIRFCNYWPFDSKRHIGTCPENEVGKREIFQIQKGFPETHVF